MPRFLKKKTPLGDEDPKIKIKNDRNKFRARTVELSRIGNIIKWQLGSAE